MCVCVCVCDEMAWIVPSVCFDSQPLMTLDSVDSVWMVTNGARCDLPTFLET